MSSKPKVLIVTREFPPYHEGGAGKRLGYLVSATSEHVDYHIVTLGPRDEYIESNNIKIFVVSTKSYIKYNIGGRIPLISNDTSVLMDIWRLDKVAQRIIEKYDIDIYEIVEPFYGAFLRHNKKKYPPKIVTILHTRQGELIHSLKEISHPSDIKFLVFLSIIGPLLDKLGMRDTCRIITDSDTIKHEVSILYNISKTNIEVVPNPVNIPPKAQRAVLRSINSPPIIAYFGRLVYRKNVSLLLKASRLLSKKGINHKLVIIGEGPIRTKLMAEASDLRNVIFTGRVPESRLHNLLASIDIIVNPSRYEGGHPLAVLEAMSFGAVPVLSKIMNHLEIIRGTQFVKYMFDYEDAISLTHGLENAIEDLAAEGERYRVIANRIVKERFSPEVSGKKLIEVYKHILEGDSPCVSQ